MTRFIHWLPYGAQTVLPPCKSVNDEPSWGGSADTTLVNCPSCIHLLALHVEDTLGHRVHLVRDNVPGSTFCGAQSDWDDPTPGARFVPSNTTSDMHDVTCWQCLQEAKRMGVVCEMCPMVDKVKVERRPDMCACWRKGA